MNNTMQRFLPIILLFASSALLLSACSVFKVGEINAVKEANELAIACKTDEALAVVDRALQGGGLGAGIGELLRVVILRDAGRTAEANAAMVERNKHLDADAENVADAEEAVAESLKKLRNERYKQTGRSTCD